MPPKKPQAAGASQPKVDPRNVYISGTSKAGAQQKGPKSAADASDEFRDEEKEKQILFLKEFFKHLLKGIKTIALYRHNVAQYPEYLQNSYKLLSQFLDKYESIPLRVEQLGFKFQDEWIYQEDASDQNLAHKFYRDGVRILVFRKGIDREEMLNFVLIMLTNFRATEYMHDDMVSLLWKQEFAFVEYVVVDSVAVGGDSEEEARIEVDKIVNYLYKRLTSQSEDHFQFARISLEDLEIELEDVEQAKGVQVKGTPASKEQKSTVQDQLDEEDANRMLPKLVVILFKVLEEEMDQDLGQAMEQVFVQLLDSFLIHEDFRGINQMLRKFKTIGRKKLPSGNQARIQQIEESFITRMGEAERLDQVAQIIDTMAEIKQSQEVYRYLTRLDEQSIMPMLQSLEHMERKQARRLFCDALATLGKDQIEVFVRRLESKKANLVRDMLYIIDKLNPADKLKMISKLLDHPNLAIRLEALKTLGSSGEDSCRAYVIKALSDEDMQMRIMAARLLPNFDLSMATRTLLSIVGHQDFTKRHATEQAATYAALATTNSPDAMAFFREQLRSTSLLSKKKLIEHKRNIVSGLAISGSIAAFKLLKAELEAGIKEEEVSASAERACNKLREKLLGS